jgi:ATP-binding cassette subfamily F protein 3
VLDEPTNHLDIPSREALEEALSAFEGTIITISHDRYFLDRVATQILSLDGEGVAEHYDGDYTEYHDWKLGGAPAKPREQLDHENLVALTSTPVVNEEPVQTQSPQTKKKSESTKPSKPGVKLVKKKKADSRTSEMIESDIAAAEALLTRISEQMGTPEVARDANRMKLLNAEYRQTEDRLRSLYEEWDRVSQEPAKV